MAQPLVDGHPGAVPSLLCGLPLESDWPLPAPAPVMGAAEKVQGWELPPRPEYLPGLALARLDQVGLRDIQAQSILGEPFRQNWHTSLGLVRAFKPLKAIVRLPDLHTVPPTMGLDHSGNPLIEHFVQVDVGHYRRDN